MYGATIPKWLIGDLRSDHAGETGAVWIYRGILFVSSDRSVRDFAERHLISERRHLREIEVLLPPADRSRLLPIWRIAGFITGALPALAGSRSVFHTVEAVEAFVDSHYAAQIQKLEPNGDSRQSLNVIRAVLVGCRGDEIEHYNEARQLATSRPGPVGRLWCALVALGSELAVAFARRI
ncbi:MAG: ubiquinone biosynthesis protein COQ7 [Rhodospirillaceae bacterium]|nr:ubiquinone biosynthesis protein COQ7 [Rhodospirillaceae bacterium]